MLIKTTTNHAAQMPTRGTKLAAGLDLHASLENPLIRLHPGMRILISTGIAMELPAGTVGIVCPRSGLALKHGVTVLNAPGIVDADYRGDIGVILVNLGQEPFDIHNGDRIAQLVIIRHEYAIPVLATSLSESGRGNGGFGSTGLKAEVHGAKSNENIQNK